MTSAPGDHLQSITSHSLIELHEATRRAYENDRSLSDLQATLAQNFGSELSYFGVDEFSDWPRHVKAIEDELSRRGIGFEPIRLGN